MSVLDIAQSIRKATVGDARPIPLGKAQQLTAAAFGYRSLAALQAAQKADQESPTLDWVDHIVVDAILLADRAGQLDLPHSSDDLVDLMVDAIGEHLGRATIHHSQNAFEEFLEELVQREVGDDERVNDEMGNANFDGVDEVYVPIEDTFGACEIGTTAVLQFVGHVTLGLDLERPYCGHVISVEGEVRALRFGCNCFGEIQCVVTKAELGDGSDEEDVGEPRVRSAAELYAELLGLSLQEVGDLVDVDPEPQEGHSGEMVYSYVLDFTGQTSPEIERKILQKHGSLRIEVDLGFFDGARTSDWPR